MDNYNSEQTGIPYTRFGEIEIYFGDSLSGNSISAILHHYKAIRAENGDVYPIGQGINREVFPLPKLSGAEAEQWAQPIPKRNYLTGEQIVVGGVPQTTTLIDCLTSIYSVSVHLKEGS